MIIRQALEIKRMILLKILYLRVLWPCKGDICIFCSRPILFFGGLGDFSVSERKKGVFCEEDSSHKTTPHKNLRVCNVHQDARRLFIRPLENADLPGNSLWGGRFFIAFLMRCSRSRLHFTREDLATDHLLLG